MSLTIAWGGGVVVERFNDRWEAVEVATLALGFVSLRSVRPMSPFWDFNVSGENSGSKLGP